MDRRVLVLITVACGRATPRPIADAAPFAFPRPEIESHDAAAEPDAEPIAAGDVLSGAAAEQAIASGKAVAGTPGESVGAGEPLLPPAAAERPVYLIGSEAVGPFRLGAARAEVVKQLQGRALFQRLPTAPGEPSAEAALVPGGAGHPLLRLRVYAGRLQEIQILARDKRAVTDAGLGVGASFAEVMNAYGEPRLVRDERSGRRLGFVFQDLAGVLFLPAVPAAELPAPATRVARIVVVGAEETAED